MADSGPFSPEGLLEMERAVYELPTTSLLVYDGDRLAYQYGNGSDVSYLASARKSILSMLYGKYVADGTIDLDATLADLDIQDNETLSEAERQATVRHLLSSGSGVYHPAGSPGGDDNNPPRGSKAPGSHFQYNNWDFNVLGAIFEKRTGRTLFEALRTDLAEPLGFEDYDIARQKMLGYGNRSRYLAYHMFLSGRDMGKLGQLMLRRGEWKGRQVVPADWVAESTKERFTSAQTAGPSGYAYLWWTPERAGEAWKGSYLANGNLGQFILVLPAIDTVIVHRRAVTDQYAMARNFGETAYLPPAVKVGTFLEIADRIVAARA
ncbi:serine hydrolase domain-containing protein [Aureimonas jatrophae]|nr:serine hydrolase [Aureimonas jatrophae]MBB3951921.1 CubicO group peptidase (beta-lactamase class C family) [Aureimonas jatrophae]